METPFRYEQNKFQEQLSNIHHDLTNWELKHAGFQTFSKAFEPLIDSIFMRKSKNYGLKKNTLPGVLRQAENSKKVGKKVFVENSNDDYEPLAVN